MKSLFEQFGDTYRKENDYVIPNLEMPDIANFKIGIYGQRHLYFCAISTCYTTRIAQHHKLKNLCCTFKSFYKMSFYS